MKKVLVCALAVFFLLASCSTAFAAEVTTTTTYVAGDSSKMTVTTIVTGATEGKMYTFLATNGEKNAENVVAADQKTVGTDGNLEFTYTGNTTDFISLSAFSGNNENNNMSSESGLARSVTVKFEGAELEDVELILPGLGTTVPFNVDIPYNKKIASVTWNDGEIKNLGYSNGQISNDFPDDATLTVTLENATENKVDADPAFGKIFWRKSGNEVLTVFAKITSLVPGTEFGIELSTDGGETWPEDYRFAAKEGAGTDGSFAVQLINQTAGNRMENAEFAGKTVKARVYYGDDVTEAFDVEDTSSPIED